jgi:hypothetical protein
MVGSMVVAEGALIVILVDAFHAQMAGWFAAGYAVYSGGIVSGYQKNRFYSPNFIWLYDELGERRTASTYSLAFRFSAY